MVSVIIPVLNESQRIEGFLRHLQPFRHAGHELIIVDGGSTDGSPEKCMPYVDKVLRTSAGRAHQMNVGAHVAKGNMLLFQHVDTWLPVGAEAVLSRLSESDELIWGRFDVRLTPGHWLFPVISLLMNWRSRFTHIATGDQSIFISRPLFDEVGGFPEQLLMEDVELCSRLRRLLPPVCLSDKVVTSSRRWQKQGVWKTIVLMWRFRLAYSMGTPSEKLASIYYPNIKPVTDQKVEQLHPKSDRCSDSKKSTCLP